ncbi:MAG: M24 family metallopeptidase [Chlorobiales bacterium]|jgi:methionyl aminopeptidase|nr:M24 family metallopeptidase [Chlorobiales bacterium]
MSVISNAHDIEKLRHSGRILASCCYHMEELLRPGTSAADLNTFCTEFIRGHDAEPSFLNYSGFPHALCFSNNAEVVHGVCAPEKILKVGDMISLDLGVNYKGLFSDIAVTYIITENGVDRSCKAHFTDLSKDDALEDDAIPSELKQKRELLEATQKALAKGIAAVHAGAKTGDIGYAVGTYLTKRGFGNVTELGGHGLGYKVHEPPYISHVGKKGTGTLLLENEVIAIEPMVTMGKSGKVKFVSNKRYGWDEVFTRDGSVASHFEHSLFVTKNGCDIITRIRQEDVLPIKAVAGTMA